MHKYLTYIPLTLITLCSISVVNAGEYLSPPLIQDLVFQRDLELQKIDRFKREEDILFFDDTRIHVGQFRGKSDIKSFPRKGLFKFSPVPFLIELKAWDSLRYDDTVNRSTFILMPEGYFSDLLKQFFPQNQKKAEDCSWYIFEIIKNAVDHGARINPENHVIVSWEITGKSVKITCTDEGSGERRFDLLKKYGLGPLNGMGHSLPWVFHYSSDFVINGLRESDMDHDLLYGRYDQLLKLNEDKNHWIMEIIFSFEIEKPIDGARSN